MTICRADEKQAVLGTGLDVWQSLKSRRLSGSDEHASASTENKTSVRNWPFSLLMMTNLLFNAIFNYYGANSQSHVHIAERAFIGDRLQINRHILWSCSSNAKGRAEFRY